MGGGGEGVWPEVFEALDLDVGNETGNGSGSGNESTVHHFQDDIVFWPAVQVSTTFPLSTFFSYSLSLTVSMFSGCLLPGVHCDLRCGHPGKCARVLGGVAEQVHADRYQFLHHQP